MPISRTYRRRITGKKIVYNTRGGKRVGISYSQSKGYTRSQLAKRERKEFGKASIKTTMKPKELKVRSATGQPLTEQQRSRALHQAKQSAIALKQKRQFSQIQYQKTGSQPQEERQLTREQFDQRARENLPTEAYTHKQLLSWGYTPIKEKDISQYERAEGYLIKGYETADREKRYFKKYDPDLWVAQELAREKGISVMKASQYVERTKRERKELLKGTAIHLATSTSFEGFYGASNILESGLGYVAWKDEGLKRASASILLRQTREVARVTDPKGKVDTTGTAIKGLEAGAMGGILVAGSLINPVTSKAGKIATHKFLGVAKTGAGGYIAIKGVEGATKGSVRGLSQTAIGSGLAVSGVSDLKKGFFPQTKKYVVEYPVGAKVVKKVKGKTTYVEPITKKQTFATKKDADLFAKAVKPPKKYQAVTTNVRVSEYGGERVTAVWRGKADQGISDLKVVKKLPQDVLDDIVWSGKRFTQRVSTSGKIKEPFVTGTIRFEDVGLRAEKILGSQLQIGQSGTTTGGQSTVIKYERPTFFTKFTKTKPYKSLSSMVTRSKSKLKSVFSKPDDELALTSKKPRINVQLKNVPKNTLYTKTTKALKEGEIFLWSKYRSAKIPRGVFSSLKPAVSTVAVSQSIGSQVFFIPASAKSNISPLQQTVTRQSFKQMKEPFFEFDSKQEERQALDTGFGGGTSGGQTQIIEQLPVINTVPILFGLGGEPPSFWGKKRSRSKQKKKQKKVYRRSLIAQAFNIKGKKPKVVTGFGIRPIVSKKKVKIW